MLTNKNNHLRLPICNLRISKNNIQYYWDGENLAEENNGSGLNLRYYYDAEGIAAIEYAGNLYYFLKNLQGDIKKTVDSAGNPVASYEYNAWGKVKVYNPDGTENTNNSFIGNINPFRYRGYYYDTETGLYYLKSRYYDPVIGRFISPDSINYLAPETINGLNLYAYCGNNPVILIDSIGHAPEVNGDIDIWSLFNKNGNIWYSGRYKPKNIFKYDLKNPFKHIGNNLVYFGEVFLSSFEARVLSWNLSAVSLTDSSFTLISAGVDVFDGRLYLSNSDYLGVKIGTLKFDFIDVNWGSEAGFTLIDAQATALTVGTYSQYLDAEVLVGSVGAALSFKDGTLKIGFSLGWGIKITIRFW